MSAERILVVDDEPIIGLAFERELSKKGFIIESVLSGAEALKVVQREKFDLVFIDKMMPEMDGITTCREIRKICPQLKPIFMTGVLDSENMMQEWRFTEAGGRTYYLYKPFAEGELLEVALKALEEGK